MARTHPTHCDHGKVIDWGDFGPDENDPTVGTEDCDECDTARWLRHMEVLRVEPGDVLVVKADRPMTFDVAQRIKKQVKEVFPDTPCLVLDGLELGVVRQAEAS